MRFLKLALICLAIGLTGCASGVKYKDMASSIAPLQPDQGRIYFFRSNSMVGAAIQPNVMLDSKAVGESKPGGFFYIDTNPGGHLVSTTTEVKNELTLVLDPGETKYVKTSTSLGLFVGHVTPELISPEEAKPALQDLSYTGDVAHPGQLANSSKPETGVAIPQATAAASDVKQAPMPAPVAHENVAAATQVPQAQSVQTFAVASTTQTAPQSAPQETAVAIAPVRRGASNATVIDAQNVEFKLGESSVTVERMAKQTGCESKLGAGLISNTGPVEMYRMSCKDGSAYLAKCELRQCSQMQE